MEVFHGWGGLPRYSPILLTVANSFVIITLVGFELENRKRQTRDVVGGKNMGGQFLVYEIPCLSSCLLTDYIYIFLRRYSEDSFEINLVFLIKREKESTFIQLFHPSFLSFSSFSSFHYSNILFCEVTCFETLLLSSHRAKKNFWISWSLLSGACVD